MCCHALFIIVGLYALFAGKFTLMRNRTVEGNRARLIGLVLLLPTVITFCLALANIESGPSGADMDQETATQIDGLSVILLIGALLIAAYLTLTAPPSFQPVPYAMPDTFGSQQLYYSPGMLGSTPAEKAILTPAEAAAYLRVSEADVLALIESGQIVAGKLGTQYRVSKESLDAYLNQKSGGTV